MATSLVRSIGSNYEEWTWPKAFCRYRSGLIDSYRRAAIVSASRAPKRHRPSSGPSKQVEISRAYINLVLLPQSLVDESLEDADVGSVDEVRKIQDILQRGSAQRDRDDDDQRAQRIDLQSVFPQSSAASTRVSVTSCAGGGKSTLFLQKAPHDWATGALWFHFLLVAALPLRMPAVHTAENMAELLGLQGRGFTRLADRDAIVDFVRENAQKMCLLLDGLDEINLEKCSSYVRSIIEGGDRSEPGLNILVTSRHSQNMHELQRSHPFDQGIELLGFSHEDAERFVRSHLSDKDDAGTLLKELRCNQQIWDLMCIPFIASRVCDLHQAKRKVPTSIANLFTSITLLGIQAKTGKKCSDWESLPPHMRESILEVGSFAFYMMARNRTVFENADFTDLSLSKAAHALKLLSPCATATAADLEQSQFEHLSIQETLAAKFIAHTCKSREDLVSIVRQLRPLSGHLTTFWELLAAEVSTENLDVLLNAILSQYDPSESSHMARSSSPQDTDTSYLTSPDQTLIKIATDLTEYLAEGSIDALAIRLLDPVAGGSGDELVKGMLQPGANNSIYLTRVLFLWRRKVPSASSRILCEAVRAVHPLAAAKCFPEAQYQPATPSAMPRQQPSTSYLPTRSTETQPAIASRRRRFILACRCFAQHAASASTFMDSRSAQSFLPGFARSLQRIGIDLDKTILSVFDCQSIGTALETFPGLVSRISLSDCRIGDRGLACILPGLCKLQGLTTLNLFHCSITDVHAESLAGIIHRSCTSLKILQTNWNGFTPSGNVQVHRLVGLCKKLIYFAMGTVEHAMSREQALDTLRPILTGCTLLTTLAITNMLLGDSGLSDMSPLLSSLKLSVIFLQNIDLSNRCTSVLVTMLTPHLSRLTFLDLSENSIGDAVLLELTEILEQCRNLEWLLFRGTSLTSASLPALTRLVVCLPCLAEMSLSENTFKAGQKEEGFTAAVCGSRSFRKLIMPEQHLVSRALAESLLSIQKENFTVIFRAW